MSLPPQGSAPLEQNEVVTLSAQAADATSLLTASRDSDGIDHQAVGQIRSAIENGTYNVSPEDLAQSISNVLKDFQ